MSAVGGDPSVRSGPPSAGAARRFDFAGIPARLGPMSSRFVRESRWVLLAVVAMFVVVVAERVMTTQRCDFVRWIPWRLVATVLLLPALLLVTGYPRAALASAASQVLVVTWFVTVSCDPEDRGLSSGFVGGLGVVYLIAYSLIATLVPGGIGFAFDRRERRRARSVGRVSG